MEQPIEQPKAETGPDRPSIPYFTLGPNMVPIVDKNLSFTDIDLVKPRITYEPAIKEIDGKVLANTKLPHPNKQITDVMDYCYFASTREEDPAGFFGLDWRDITSHQCYKIELIELADCLGVLNIQGNNAFGRLLVKSVLQLHSRMDEESVKDHPCCALEALHVEKDSTGQYIMSRKTGVKNMKDFAKCRLKPKAITCENGRYTAIVPVASWYDMQNSSYAKLIKKHASNIRASCYTLIKDDLDLWYAKWLESYGSFLPKIESKREYYSL